MLSRSCTCGRLLVAGALVSSILGAGDALPISEPEKMGVSSERLTTMHAFVDSSVRDYPLTGAVTLVARDGQIVDWRSYGHRDQLAGLPMRRDDIFILASLTKPIVSAGVMILVEQGALRLSDPVAKWIPGLANPRVFLGTRDGEVITRPAKGRIQVRHLLTHTAGWPGRRDDTELGQLLTTNKFRQASTMDDMIAELARLPLQSDPGTAWIYGPSTDVLGALIERVSGQTLGEFLQEHLFEPLGMEDTFFEVPSAKRHRVVPLFRSEAGALAYFSDPAHRGSMRRPYQSGSGGLYSTPADYFRFAQMLLNQGTFNGQSVLGKMTVISMTRNQCGFLGDAPKSNNLSEAFGFGVSVKISTEHEKDMSSVGTYGWGGSTTTWCRIDPQERYIAMFFSQHTPMASSLVPPFANTAWQAIVE